MNLKHANTLHYFIIVVSFAVLLIKSASLINNDPHQQPKNITITSTKTFQNSSSSTIITKSNLREIFDFSGAQKWGEGKLLQNKKELHVDTSTPSSSFTHRMTSSTFRPTSSILFLTPPKPKHIASIVSELNSIELDPSGGYLTLRWSVIVVLKANSTTNSTTLKFKRSTEKTKEEKEENKVENNKKEEEEEEEVVVNLTSEKDSETPLKNFTSSTTPQTPTNSSSSSSSTTPENITISTSTSISPAKVEQARTPLKWVITLRRYGHAHRERFPIEDRENNLDPPFTGNKSYHYRLEHLSPESSYELCIQSVNGGRLKESAEVRRLFPLNAHASGVVGGAGNPLFICKEVYVSPPETTENKNNNTETDLFEVEILGSQRKSTKTQHKNRDQIRGRLAEGEKSSEGSETPAIEVSEEAADAFVVYTAITSGSTTVLLLIVVVTFCCCRCNKRKTEHREYRQNILYSRAPAGEGGGGSHGEGSGSAPKYF